MKNLFISALMAASCTLGFAQENAPWQKFKDQTVNGVYLHPGCHEHSLSGGQGFAVYLKNNTNVPVNVTAWLVAKTTCGKEAFSKLDINLAANEINSGSDFTAGSKTGQTSFVTQADCYGTKYAKDPKKLDRINEVYIKDVIVTSMGEAAATPASTGTTGLLTTTSTTTTAPAKPSGINIDSMTTEWANTKTGLEDEISKLKTQYQTTNDLLTAKTLLADSLSKMAAKKMKSASNNTFHLLGGVGYDMLPTFNNNFSTAATTQSNIGFPLMQMGVLAKLFNSSKLNVELNPFASYGNSLSKENRGNHLAYGIIGNIIYGINDKLKIVGTTGLAARNGDWTKGTNEFGNYNYNYIKYGGGVRYALNNMVSLQPTVVFDNANESNNNKSNAMVINLDAIVNKVWNIGVSYGSNYNIQGTSVFTAPEASQNLMSIRFLRSFDIK